MSKSEKVRRPASGVRRPKKDQQSEAGRRPPDAGRSMPFGRILSIGDELVLGRTVDTNATHIARWLTDRGLKVDLVQQVGDGQAEIVAGLERAAEGAAVVLVTGGLGPTDDDRTRHALAEAMGVALAEHAPSWKQIRAYFQRGGRGRTPEVNRRQALLPRGAQAIVNHRGTAPGMLARLRGAWVACMPGVPHEMIAMLDGLSTRLPKLVKGLRAPDIAELWFAGIGESTAQELIGDLLTERDPQVGITVSEQGHITLRVVGRGAEVARRQAELAKCLEPHLLTHAGIAPSVVAALTERDQTIAAAESCTCGHVAAAIGAVPGASAILRESVVAYHEEVKRGRLGVDAALIASEGEVSEAVARAMAEGVRRLTGADIAVATTGVAGPGGATARDPIGTVWVAVADAAGAAARRHQVNGNRERVQRRGAAYALQLAWDRLRGKA
jgi:nicotinamide-nucleotide amidase